MRTIILFILIAISSISYSQIIGESYFIGQLKEPTLRVLEQTKWDFASHRPTAKTDTFQYIFWERMQILTLCFSKETNKCNFIKLRVSFFQVIKIIEKLQLKAQHYGNYPNTWKDKKFYYKLEHEEYYMFLLSVTPIS